MEDEKPSVSVTPIANPYGVGASVHRDDGKNQQTVGAFKSSQNTIFFGGATTKTSENTTVSVASQVDTNGNHNTSIGFGIKW
jgi:hypothetical protein